MFKNYIFTAVVGVLVMSATCYFSIKWYLNSAEKKKVEAGYVSKNYEIHTDNTAMRDISIVDHDQSFNEGLK